MTDTQRGIFVLVEGRDDSRFFERIVNPTLEQSYAWLKMVEHSPTSAQWINNLLRNTDSMNADYIYVVDLDECPSPEVRKRKTQQKLPHLDDDRVVVVIKEIESWYLAGIGQAEASFLGLEPVRATDNVEKQNFDRRIPDKYRASRIDFMVEILNNYSVSTAREKNASFDFFWSTFCTHHDTQTSDIPRENEDSQ